MGIGNVFILLSDVMTQVIPCPDSLETKMDTIKGLDIILASRGNLR